MRRRTIIITAGVAIVAALGLGGAAIAGAAGAFDDEGSLGGAAAERARAAALEVTAGGTANAVERDSENGATYEVEVTKRDGSTVDVRLDGSFGVVAVDDDSETADADDD